MRYATVEAVTLSPIPCWAHLSPELYRARISALVEAIETEAARERERTVGAFREASERMRRGDRDAPFPLGSFPPALPFVAG